MKTTIESQLTEAIEKVNIQMVNSIEHGAERSLGNGYVLYKYIEDDIIVIAKESNTSREEVLIVLADGERLIFEEL